MKRQIFLLLSIILFLSSCTKEPRDYPIEPEISYQSMTPHLINLEDTSLKVIIALKFTDGDGDLGNDASQSKLNIFLKDSRDTSQQAYTYSYPFPYISEDMRSSKGGLEGFININLGKQYFSVTDSLNIALRRDTLQYDIYIEDDAGHKSNVVKTDSLFIEF